MLSCRTIACHHHILAGSALAVAAVTASTWYRGRQTTADQARLVDELSTWAHRETEAVEEPVRIALFHPQVPGLRTTPKLAPVFHNRPDCVWAPVTPEEIRAGKLREFDVVIFPGGSGRRHATLLQERGRKAVKDFVASGGGYVGICAGAFLAAANYDWSLAIVNAKTITGIQDVGSGQPVHLAMRGSANVEIEVTDAGNQVFASLPSRIEIAYSDGPVLSPAGRADLDAYVCLATFRGEVCQHEVQRGTMIGTPAVVAARFGEGRVILFSPHPEKTPNLESMLARAALAVTRRHPQQSVTRLGSGMT